MVETAGKTKKNYNKIGTEDDPVIIAQRFLNIFRQLHIFTDERKQAFNQMILEQPAEIRGMFSSLPGGAVLQQYVDELEEKNGLVRSTPDAAPQADYEEETRAKILATALAEANNQHHTPSADTQAETAQIAAQAAAEAAARAAAEAQAKIAVQAAQAAKEAAAAAQAQIQAQAQALAQAQAQLQAQQQAQQTGQASPAKTVFQPISSTFTADASFAKEIALALKEAIAANDDIRKKDSEAVTQAIVSSQNKLAEIMAQNNKANIEAQNRLAQMLVQNNTAANASSSNNNANNIQINTAATFPPVDEMLNGIVKIQSELFREMAKTQTSELSSIITLALKESQQLSTQSIITAIKEMQKENLKFLQAHPVVYTAPAAQAVPEDYHVSPVPRAEPLRPLPDEEINAAPAAPVIQTTDISREIFGDDTEDNDDTEIIAGGEEIAVQKKKKKKKKKKKNSEGLSLDSLASSLFDKVSTLTDKVSNLSGKKNQKEEDPAEKTANDFSFPENQEASNGGLDFSLFDNDVPSAAAEPEKTAELSPASEDTAADEDQWEYVEVPAEEILSQLQPEQTAQTEEPASEEQSSAVLADNDDWGYHTTTEEFPAENIPAEPVDLPSEEIATDWGIEADTSSAETEDISKPIQNSPLSEDTVSPEETAAEPDTAVTTEAPAEIADEGWEYVAVPEEETTAEPDTAVTDEAPAENADEGWEYAAVPEEETAAEPDTAATDEASAENTDEGWEYVAVPEEESVAESADGNTAEGNWEWEYEEVSEDDGNTAETAQPANSSAAVPTGPDTESYEAQDWEWDYEEVSEDEGTSAADAGSAIQTQSEDEGWEYVEIPEDEAGADEDWEYVEVPEEEAEAGNGDGEWEYVEIPEGEETYQAESGEGSDWEWEYEEVPEDDGSTAELPQQTESAEKTPTDDPYRPETALQTPAETETTSLSSMYSGEVYFQDNVYDNLETAKEEETFKIPEDIGDGPGLADLETGEAPNEPYKPQGTI
ncbi:unknown [Azospirillum sp. CAG:260]|nr:unknown [Azospirillum sp. CAG:260]